MDLKEINQEYENIMHSNHSDDKKAQLLAQLMTQMERQFSIPMLKNQEWENQNRKVIALYRKISRSRIFD
ncbi:hypothetical protein [Heyndrickxia sporothermodurans]|uniref:Uncharacterized protein n=1 Tax=Heyndrickxia sporothermodurans TaxID=46224 RepID=A0AB37HKM2_9BACI|nr:hypothetical protein [Heyndrickxia sporothermodurans]MBL5772724.1 hypothetical protein [Heyndrickxia sporothermodurans]MBL5783426.1 hypothetical protein [Heyndrickxia sporothermodurans]MBL5790439.1 hypothetical protein [Heyndrickxia sporothermodurans]MBL5797984.1 hypothetical protein [Heyndrickxia sporothermodurans]MBL5801407.1 hypothetical protein [Heyndrickxia sporothermodurans]